MLFMEANHTLITTMHNMKDRIDFDTVHLLISILFTFHHHPLGSLKLKQYLQLYDGNADTASDARSEYAISQLWEHIRSSSSYSIADVVTLSQLKRLQIIIRYNSQKLSYPGPLL
jgi:hypothetical protein